MRDGGTDVRAVRLWQERRRCEARTTRGGDRQCRESHSFRTVWKRVRRRSASSQLMRQPATTCSRQFQQQVDRGDFKTKSHVQNETHVGATDLCSPSPSPWCRRRRYRCPVGNRLADGAAARAGMVLAHDLASDTTARFPQRLGAEAGSQVSLRLSLRRLDAPGRMTDPFVAQMGCVRRTTGDGVRDVEFGVICCRRKWVECSRRMLPAIALHL